MRIPFACLAVSFALAALSLPSGGAAPLVSAALAQAHSGHATDGVTAGDLEISSFWARAMLPGQPAGGGYLTIASKGGPDRLIEARSPAAGKVEIHEMEMTGGVMVMRPVAGGLDIPAGGRVELKPGGLHLMFMAPSEPFKEGQTVTVLLRFEKAGEVAIDLPVRPARGGHDDH